MAATDRTGGHAMDANGDSLGTYAALEAAGRLCRSRAVKLFLEGTADNGTAWLEQPHCHGNPPPPSAGPAGCLVPSWRAAAGAALRNLIATGHFRHGCIKTAYCSLLLKLCSILWRLGP